MIIIDKINEIQELRERVKLLEERVRGLRSSRKILLNLLAAQDREKRKKIQLLEAEVSRLKKHNTQLSRSLMDKNVRIVRLEQKEGEKYESF